jgi:hypothetical protein
MVASIRNVMGASLGTVYEIYRRQAGMLAFFIILLIAAALLVTTVGCGRQHETKETTVPEKLARKEPEASETKKKTVYNPSMQGNAKPAQDANPAKSVGPLIEVEQKTVTLRWVEKGVLRMSATAREGRINELTKTGVLTDFSANLYENGKLTASLTAPKVSADTVNRIVTATGGVTVKSTVRNTTLKAGWVKWFAREQKLIGNGGVKIKTDMWEMESAAFVADTGLKTLTLKNSAKGLAQ